MKKKTKAKQPDPQRDEFHERFIQVLELESSKFWMKELGIQLNLLWGWKKGNYPGLRYAMEICRIAGVSPNWLFMGLGPRFIEDLDDVDDAVLLDETLKEEMLADMMRLRKQVKQEKENSDRKVNEIMSDIETIRLLKSFSEIFTPGMDMHQVKKHLPADILNKVTLPVLSFMETHSDEMVKKIKSYVGSDDGTAMFMGFVSWILERKLSPQA